VRYLESAALWIIVGLTAGCTIVLIIIIIIVVVVCRRRRNKASTEDRDDHSNNNAGSIELDDDDRNYCTIPAAEAGADSNANEYCSTGPIEPGDCKEYSVLGPPTGPINNSPSPYYLSLQENAYE